MTKLKGYVASHFFDRGGYLQTEEIANFLTERYPNIEWYVPQRNDEINDKQSNDDIITDVKVYEADIQEHLMKSDIVVANCDGVEIDSGVAGEILGKAMQNELEVDNVHMELDLEKDELRERDTEVGLIVGYTTDIRRNKTGKAFLNELKEMLNQLQYTKALEKMENHKENFLYRNIMVTGAVNRWGKMVNGYAANSYYLEAIANEIDIWLEDRQVHL